MFDTSSTTRPTARAATSVAARTTTHTPMDDDTARPSPADDAFAGRVVVLGAGQVARHLVDELHSRGVRPLVLSRSGTELADADHAVVDVADTDALTTALDGASLVISTAQPAYHRWVEEFPALQASIVEAVGRRDARLVVLENLYAYGPVDGPVSEQHPLVGHSRKGTVRAEMSRDLVAAHQAGRVRAAAVRASDFFGPHARLSTAGERMIEPLLAGKPAEVLGDPAARRSLAFLPDVAAALVTVGASDTGPGRAWHAPHAPAVTSAELVSMLAAELGVEPRIRAMPRWQMRLAGLFVKPAKEFVELWYEFERDHLVDDTDIRDVFGLDHTPLPAAVAATAAWYRAEADGSR